MGACVIAFNRSRCGLLVGEVPVVAEVSGVDDRTDDGYPAVSVVEESGDKGGFQDLVIVESGFLEQVEVLLADLLGTAGQGPGELAQGIVLGGEELLGCAEVAGEDVDQAVVLPHAAEVVSMGLQAVGTAVVGGDDDADHLFLVIAQEAVLVEEGALEIQKADVLTGVDGQDLEQVIDKAPVLHHGLHVLVKDRVLLVSHVLFSVGLLQAR